MRAFTPDRTVTAPDGRTTTEITLKRACGVCGDLVGDATDHEIDLVIAGIPLPDVRDECPTCSQPENPEDDPS